MNKLIYAALILITVSCGKKDIIQAIESQTGTRYDLVNTNDNVKVYVHVFLKEESNKGDRVKGIIDKTLQALPTYTNDDGFEYGERVMSYKWETPDKMIDLRNAFFVDKDTLKLRSMITLTEK